MPTLPPRPGRSRAARPRSWAATSARSRHSATSSSTWSSGCRTSRRTSGQTRANSGIYLQDRYEVQVLDTYGKAVLADNECGSIYLKRAPDSNPATAPETWQTYEITFRAARWSGTTKTENARVTVVWNGVTVHNDVAVDGPTGAGAAESPAALPIRLQDHGDPGANVRYRSIWIEPV
ncbi:3-keto-disaccharide hydrolase [Dactylosporangium sp. CA-233914]|uniref:3-keto-disaccharide hydrolase n=1 Tax=Dactylosporangium sp. CA-233914 TaxID=3239934 RepID=UPI003D8B00E2